MPRRLLPLVEGQVYHVFNRGIDHRPTFDDKLELKRALASIDYYRFVSQPLKFSKFLKLSGAERNKLEVKFKTGPKLIDILSFCLMPNHFHFLLRQVSDKGISKFLSNFQNSYTRYFNTKNERIGHLFLGQFKAVLIETDEQLLHVSRYIHLNPITSYIVKDFNSLLKYPWSSLPEYIKEESFCETDTILSFFKKREDYTDFLKDQVDYQRELSKIKHLVLE
ncbi:MAG: transposase [Patescibacteria group bacterium]